MPPAKHGTDAWERYEATECLAYRRSLGALIAVVHMQSVGVWGYTLWLQAKAGLSVVEGFASWEMTAGDALAQADHLLAEYANGPKRNEVLGINASKGRDIPSGRAVEEN